ncbi:MAG: SLC13 family permease [Acholeplasmatales bacterium]|nr:MAG: SLC13 family permease [Acholeplasmatales bacterium]
MPFDQVMIFLVLFVVLVLFAWGRWRYDLVAFAALMFVTVIGLVPFDEAFAGFSHPAVITVASVLLVSRGLMHSGLVDLLVRHLGRLGNRENLHLLVLLLLVTLSSAFMNNVGALALFMPVAIRLARKNNRSPSLYLMPLAFGSLLGGMMSLIGTPPNIIISTFRADSLQQAPFKMFDFLPVGGVVALSGIVFLLIFRRWLLPERKSPVSQDELFEISGYITEIIVPEKARLRDRKVREFEQLTPGDITVIAHVREGQRFENVSPYRHLRSGDTLIVRASAQDLQAVLDASGFVLSESDKLTTEKLGTEDMLIMEVSLTARSTCLNRTARSLSLRSRYGVNILGVARSGNRLRTAPGGIRLKPGDVLLLQGREENIGEVIQNFSLLPLMERNLRLGNVSRVITVLVIFASAIALAAFGILPVQIAFALAALAMVLGRFVPLREMYQSIDGPVIILLAAMIPVSQALETTGAAARIASGILTLSGGVSPVFALVVMLTVSMVLSNIVNNAAAVLLTAPIAVSLALGLNVSLDPFLMAVAIGASSAFMTPIGHQSNTLVLGPGGYRFTDYARLGVPLSLLILVVATIMIVWVWPL